MCIRCNSYLFVSNQFSTAFARVKPVISKPPFSVTNPVLPPIYVYECYQQKHGHQCRQRTGIGDVRIINFNICCLCVYTRGTSSASVYFLNIIKCRPLQYRTVILRVRVQRGRERERERERFQIERDEMINAKTS